MRENKNNCDCGCNPPRFKVKSSHCKNGHEFVHSNTFIASNGARMCRACYQIRQLKFLLENSEVLMDRDYQLISDMVSEYLEI